VKKQKLNKFIENIGFLLQTHRQTPTHTHTHTHNTLTPEREKERKKKYKQYSG